MGKWKNTRNITRKRAKMLALSQQVTTRLQCTDKKVWQTRNINTKNDPQKKHRLGTVGKHYFTGKLELVLIYQPHPYSRCGSRQIDVWFAWKIPYLSMYHLLLNTNRDIKIAIRGDGKSPDQKVIDMQLQAANLVYIFDVIILSVTANKSGRLTVETSFLPLNSSKGGTLKCKP